MTTLLTSTGQLLSTGGPTIRTPLGRDTGLAAPSYSFGAGGGGAIDVVGRTLSYAQLWEAQPWVKICVDKLAHQIASLPLKVYRKNSQNERERVIDGPLVELLSRPWPRGRGTHLKQKLAFPWLVHGNSLIAKDRLGPGAPPTRLKPLDWRYVNPILDGDEVVLWEFRRNGQVRIAPEETVHVYWESPGGAVGSSPLKQLAVTLSLEDAAQRYGISSFANLARVAQAIVLDKDAKNTPELRDAIRAELKFLAGGPDKAHQTAVLGGGADIKPIAQTAHEAELIDQRKLNREEVAAVYDIPPPMIGILDKATYSNISEQHRMLYMTVLRPRLTLIEETLMAHLIDGERAFEGLFVEFDLSEVLKGDPKERATAFKEFLAAGVYTINELRRIENLPPVQHPLANQPLIPANNMAPLGSVDAGGTSVASLLGAHVQRAKERVLSRAGAGKPDPLDAERFKRELAEDLERKLGTSADPFAGVWAAAIEAGVTDAGSDKQQLEQFFAALAA